MSMRVVAWIAAAVLVLAVSYPVLTSVFIKRREHSAALRLQAIAGAQSAFRASAGRGGYATSLASLTSPCPGAQTPTLFAELDENDWVTAGYRTMVRAARDTEVPGVDCHGRPTCSDFVASARPVRPGADGLRAFSVQAAGRIYLFFDGVPPEERDMAPGGLAMPLDALTRIP